ncbi:pleckstrin homology-like domain-containing protein [Rhinichthys klamathensis goyatoka]|uniref:pleckstrin homology-like domain-containing protein n=1 Tax=Rhinichthys klamathensis goyatoka TaxID=3034132 RepID=UPI0024B53A5D|nr:pleckstrin homology-like domain-containing protein [Rhinichthys klamathensis goyatoka]
MASEAATSNGKTDETHPKENDVWKEGWLFKKTHYTGRWKLIWFHIREDGQLIYGCNEKSAEKAINLIGARVKMLEDYDGPLGWEITPKDSKRTFKLRAGGAEEQQAWVTAICEAQLSSEQHSAKACVVQ